MKAYEIPVSAPVLKMLKRDHGYSKHMRLDYLIFWRKNTRKKTPDLMAQYITTVKEGFVMITVVCPYASTSRLYGLCRALESTFKEKMMLYVESAVDNGQDASEAIRKFMDKYDLSEDDIKWETAWKAWQRYKKKEKEKELIPLW